MGRRKRGTSSQAGRDNIKGGGKRTTTSELKHYRATMLHSWKKHKPVDLEVNKQKGHIPQCIVIYRFKFSGTKA